MRIIMKQSYFYVDIIFFALGREDHTSKRLVFNLF